MLGHLRKWLYATSLLLLLVFMKTPMCGQATEPSVLAPQAASGPSQSQSPSKSSAVDHPLLKPAGDQSSSNQQAQGSDEKRSDKEPGNKTHFRLGTVGVGLSYSHFPDGFLTGAFWPYGFYPYSFYPYGFGYAPFYYDYPLFYPPYGPSFSYGLGKGEVKLTAEPKTASVYLNEAYAGTARELKSMWLEPGAYDLSLSAPGQQEFHQRIYVLSGKWVKIAARLAPATDKTPPEESPAKSQKKSPEKSEEKQ